jgi:hypothetical protein
VLAAAAAAAATLRLRRCCTAVLVPRLFPASVQVRLFFFFAHKELFNLGQIIMKFRVTTIESL